MYKNTRSAKVLWGVLLVLLLVIGYLALVACGIRFVNGIPILEFCPQQTAAAPSALDAERQRSALLQQRIAQAQRDLTRSKQCQVKKQRPKNCPPPPSKNVLLVMDASPSMKWNYNLEPRFENEIIRLEARINELANKINNANQLNINNLLRIAQWRNEHQRLWSRYESLLNKLNRMPGKDRLDVAKESLVQVVSSSSEDITFGFVTFNRCKKPHWHGQYPPPQRNALTRRISATQTDDSTALADTILAIPGFLSGKVSKDEPVNIVLVSDGEDSCGGDPCAAARALKRNYPNVYINMIEVARGARKAQCVAKETGGQYLQHQDASALPKLLKRATGQEQPQGCE